MRPNRFCAAFAFAAAASSYAAPPSSDTIDACLSGASHRSARISKINANRVQIEELEDGRKTFVFANGKGFVGYEESKNGDSLLVGKRKLALSDAVMIDPFHPQSPSTFTPMLADWLFIEEDKRRFLCVNFNFDGLGHSGNLQAIHGLYLSPIAASDKGVPELYFTVKDIRNNK